MDELLATIANLGLIVGFWLSTIECERRLPKQRRQAGDLRQVPRFLSPATSHLWTGIILTEKTANFSPAAKWAFRRARVFLAVIPLTFILWLAVTH